MRPVLSFLCCFLISQRWMPSPLDRAGLSESSCRSASPPFANMLHVQPVASPLYKDPSSCCDLLLSEHFNCPRYVQHVSQIHRDELKPGLEHLLWRFSSFWLGLRAESCILFSLLEERSGSRVFFFVVLGIFSYMSKLKCYFKTYKILDVTTLEMRVARGPVPLDWGRNT